MLPRIFRRERPGGRTLVLDGKRNVHQPLVLTEFGGISCSTEPGDWGYVHVGSSRGAARPLSHAARDRARLQLFAGFCYTQFADTYQEANGLLTRRSDAEVPDRRDLRRDDRPVRAGRRSRSDGQPPRQLPPTDASDAVV